MGMKAGGPPKGKATLGLEAAPGAILAFERFVAGLVFLTPGERYRVTIAGGEILDNIVKHATPVAGGRIEVRAARRGRGILLAFFFNSPSFAAFMAEGGIATAGTEPLFDPAHRRWRGMGLVMARNIAKRLSFRPGKSKDRIFLEFDPE
jgi:anti-sigma regulatory factor (Ser/Thr protein kinase)